MTRSTARIQVLDGLRGLSVFLVIVSHVLIHGPADTSTWLRLFFHGELGVRFFFVISGFIITLLLIEEKRKTGRIDLKGFYLRRAVRLIPALYLFLAVTFALYLFASIERPTAACSVTALTFTGGFYRSCGWTFGHLWSLTVEECFYLSWPFLVHLGLSAPRSGVLFIFISTFARVFDYYTHRETLWVLGFLDQIAIGAWLASLYAFERAKLSVWLNRSVLGTRLLGVALIYLPHVLAHFGKAGWVLLPLGTLIQAVGIALLLGSALVSPFGYWYRILSAKWLGAVGLISYSLYLWQQLFFGSSVLGNSAAVRLTEFPLNLLFMLGCAFVSYRWVEQPVQRAYGKIRARAKS